MPQALSPRTAGLLNDLNGAVCLGCDSYHFLGERVIEKNGALDGVRSIVILIPGKKTGLVVIANKQLTVFPEAVRDEFLERYIGKSGVDLQAKERRQPGRVELAHQNPLNGLPMQARQRSPRPPLRGLTKTTCTAP